MALTLPYDTRNQPVPLILPTPALARTVDETISSSTQINLNASTTLLRVYAKDEDVYLKWGTTAVTASNFDQIVPAGQIMDLTVPAQDANNPSSPLYTAVTVIERAATAKVYVLEF